MENEILKSVLNKLRVRLSADLLLIISFCLFACGSLYYTASGKRPEKQGITVSAEPVYVSQDAPVEVYSILAGEEIDIEHDDIQYIVRNADGTPSSTMRVIKGQLYADEEGKGYLYIYVNGEASRNGIPVYAYKTEEKKKEAFLAHQEISRAAVRDDNLPVKEEYGTKNTAAVTSANQEDTSGPVIPDEGRIVLFEEGQNVPGLNVRYIKDYYAASPAMFSLLSGGKILNPGNTVSDTPVVLAETEEITAWLGQKNMFLPRIWIMTPEGERFLVDPGTAVWESSDPEVIAAEEGQLILKAAGETVLKGIVQDLEFEIHVTVTDPEETDSFTTASDDPYTLVFSEDSTSYSAERTFYWPAVMPNGKNRSAEVEGGRIYQCGSQYYYAKEDFKVKWGEEVLLNPEQYEDHLLCLSQGLTLMEGDNLSGIVPGVVFRHHDQFWVYTGCDEPDVPYEDDDGWLEISDLFDGQDDYDPGADTGPESDAFAYPDSQYNPYPGSISSNCTYAVWALANEALGVRLPNWGDAGNWYRRAGISGYPTGQNPAAYSIIVWDHHVGFVTAVNEDGTMIYIKEGNFSGRYHEGWWPVASSRHGQKLYGHIYLTNDHGDAIHPKTVEVTEGFSDTEEVFLKLLEELGLEPGEREEVYSDEVEEGYIVSYTTGELPAGSVIDYSVSIGPEPEIIIDSETAEKLAGMTREKLLEWLEDHGLEAGEETIEESEQEDGIVLRVTKGHYKEGDEVSYTVSKKKAAATPEPTLEPEPTEEPLPSEEPVDNPDVVPTADPTPDPVPSDPDPIQEPIEPEPQEPAAGEIIEPDPQPETPAVPEGSEEPAAAEQPQPEEPQQPEPAEEVQPAAEPSAEPES